MVQETREFHIGTVLSITTGRLFSPDHIGGVYKICEWMSGETGLMTHQLPRVSQEIRPYLIQQYPGLNGDTLNIPDGLNDWLPIFTWMEKTFYDEYGEMLAVAPIPKDAHTKIDPLKELAMNYPHTSVIPIVVSEEFARDNRSGTEVEGTEETFDE